MCLDGLSHGEVGDAAESVARGIRFRDLGRRGPHITPQRPRRCGATYGGGSGCFEQALDSNVVVVLFLGGASPWRNLSSGVVVGIVVVGIVVVGASCSDSTARCSSDLRSRRCGCI